MDQHLISAAQAPGWPGIPPRWTSSAKEGVGTALNPASHVWFTLSHGILNEIDYPRLDQACTRDMGLISRMRTRSFQKKNAMQPRRQCRWLRGCRPTG